MSAQTVIDNIAERVSLEGERVRAELQAGLKETRNGLAIRGARYVPAPPASQLLWGGTGRLVGWSVQATGGPVRIVLRDGRDTYADPVAVVDLADQEQESMWFGPGGVSFGEALYADLSGAGTLTGAVYLGAVD